MERSARDPTLQPGDLAPWAFSLGNSNGKVYSASSSVPVFEWDLLRQVLIDHVHGALVRVAAKADYTSPRLIVRAPAKKSRIAAMDRLERASRASLRCSLHG